MLQIDTVFDWRKCGEMRKCTNEMNKECGAIGRFYTNVGGGGRKVATIFDMEKSKREGARIRRADDARIRLC